MRDPLDPAARWAAGSDLRADDPTTTRKESLMRPTLTDDERAVLIRLIGDALEGRASAIKDLVNECRPKLYVIFARLSESLVLHEAPEAVETDENDSTGAGTSRPRAVS
jgi:hypothetical protein